MTLRVFSYGGGVQSTAALVLSARGVLDFPLFIFANTGEDSEHPDTLRYVREIAMPYAAEHGIELIELQRRMRSGEVETLRGRIFRTRASVPIPARMQSGAPSRRTCTADFKARTISKELKRRGATKDAPAIVGLGISTDESIRVGDAVREDNETLVWPFVFDLKYNRQDCINVIKSAGLPVPAKSACFFCPYHSRNTWRDLKRRRPDLFADACAIESQLSMKSERAEHGPIYMTDDLVPLAQAVGEGTQLVLGDSDEAEICESGWCMT